MFYVDFSYFYGQPKIQGLQTLSVKSNFDVRRRKIGEIFNVKVFS